MGTLKKILIIGVGNTIKGDDGIGAYICACLEKKALPGVQTLVVHQLDTHLTEELIAADITIVTDASVEGTEVLFFKVNADGPSGVSSTHYMSAGLLMQMAKLVYNKDINLHVCSVAGYYFNTTGRLSVKAKKNADKAVRLICKWIAENS